MSIPDPIWSIINTFAFVLLGLLLLFVRLAWMRMWTVTLDLEKPPAYLDSGHSEFFYKTAFVCCGEIWYYFFRQPLAICLCNGVGWLFHSFCSHRPPQYDHMTVLSLCAFIPYNWKTLGTLNSHRLFPTLSFHIFITSIGLRLFICQ